jgi:hypothetical protein
VCGTPFSGTSLVAGTLRHLGVYMGKEFTHEGVHQDVEFSTLRTHKERLATLRKQDAEFFSWGFKSVDMRHWIPDLLPYIRDPVFLFCSRGLAESMESKSPYTQGQMADLNSHLAEEAFWCNFFLTNAVPWCVLKYKTDPEILLDWILEFTGIDATDRQMHKALKFNDPIKGYQTI